MLHFKDNAYCFGMRKTVIRRQNRTYICPVLNNPESGDRGGAVGGGGVPFNSVRTAAALR